MMRRLSSVFKSKDKENTKSSPASAENGATSSSGPARRLTLGVTRKSTSGTASSNPQVFEGPDHSVKRAGIVGTLESLGKVISTANRPLNTETGDGSYDTKQEQSGLWDDLKALRIKDLETLQMTIKQEIGSSNLADDKTMLMEKLIQLVANLPGTSKTRVKLTEVLVDELWGSLEHPPASMLGDKYNYRQADGSYNNIKFPDIGKAGTAYARSVTPKIVQPNPKPDPGLIFDTIMSRENGGFKPHPNNISSMLYYIASIIIHDCFRTSHEDFNISMTSSYLDLSPLYGSNQDEQNNMRTLKDGELKPDCFSEKRLLGFPPGVGCILIMFNRFHNYVVKQLATINENGRFTPPKDNLSDDKKQAAWKKYDNDLFQTGRLITCGLYINIILLDYLRTIVGLNRVNSTWTLDPRIEMERNSKPGTAAGVGNQCAAEFNLVYRWHSCISQRDEKWSEELYMKIFGKSYKEVTMQELLIGLGKLEAMTPEDPLQRDFAGMKRGTDGKLNDDDLVKELTASIEDLAGSSGANNVPAVLRAVEILGMEQARAWKCATLNEFRKHFGLIPHEKFSDINSDPAVYEKLKVLFDEPDLVELYAGLVCEDAKAPMDPGVGIGPTYTISRSILSDAVTLVRGDRFYTTDYHPANLTNWGVTEVKYDLNVNQGCVFYKLFIRAFPNHFSHNSIYAHYPLTIPSENKKIMEKLGRANDYSWDKPVKVPERKNIVTYDGVKSVLTNAEAFGVDNWRRGLAYLMGKPGANFMLAGDGDFFAERRNQMKECLYQDKWHESVKNYYESIVPKLLKRWSYNIGGTTNQVDVIRDIDNSAHVHFAANVFHLPLKSEDNPKGVYTEHELYMVLAVIFIVIFFGDVDPAKTFALRAAGLPVTQDLGQLVEQNVNFISKTSLVSGIVDTFMEENNALKDYGVHMVRHLLKAGLGVHETVWSQILPTAGAMVANQAQVFGQVLDFYLGDGKEHLPEINRLAKLNTAEADDILLHYLLEGIRMYGTFGAYRTCHQNITVNDGSRKVDCKPGDSVFVSFVSLAQDPKIYPDPKKVRLDRPVDSYLVYGVGSHACLGAEASRVALTAMLKCIGRLDNLRRAPGPQGEMKKIPREGGFYVYMDKMMGSEFPFPTTMKICWDGGLNEPVPVVEKGKGKKNGA
ncbi:putative fatty acid oxygenase protein [Botrytis fragariae]|uniref:Putative fatty acid oxygenase protein n=1 Tax=Botrytis fragariae TaxID=1964551 RepID=A0A8H6EF06_9HELO|nr:putative fatty acid oxygenase protein [Botrytis fragariae]KAF5869761.1 putative fatty acid oxygenase protein [Botrytis fragariae]